MEYLGVLSTLLYDFQHDVGLFRLGDFHSVEFLVVQIDPILVVRLAHFAGKGSPFNSNAELVVGELELLSEPSPQAVEVNVLNRACAFARADQRVVVLPWL